MHGTYKYHGYMEPAKNEQNITGTVVYRNRCSLFEKLIWDMVTSSWLSDPTLFLHIVNVIGLKSLIRMSEHTYRIYIQFSQNMDLLYFLFSLDLNLIFFSSRLNMYDKQKIGIVLVYQRALKVA